MQWDKKYVMIEKGDLKVKVNKREKQIGFDKDKEYKSYKKIKRHYRKLIIKFQDKEMQK